MRYYFKYSIFLLLCAVPCFLKAQIVESPELPVIKDESPPAKRQYYLFSPRVSVTVPHPIANKAFKNSFVGIYEVSGGLNLMIVKGLFIGVTYKNGLLKITENNVADYNARLNFNNAGIKVGGDAFVGERNRIIFSSAITVGNNWSHYSGQSAKNPAKTYTTSYSCGYVEPEVNLFFLIEANFGIGATLSYSAFNKNFDPFEYTLNNYANFDYYKPGISSYISFGFGFYYSFLKKK